MSITQVSGADPDQLWDALGDARTLLLLASDSPAVDEVCSALLSVASPGDTKLLSVTLDGSPDDRLATLRAHYGELPAETGVIAVGETTRSAASTAPTGPETAVVSIDTVSDPSDLTGLAMSVGAYLDAWSDTTATPVVCFHSITSLLFHADTNRVFRFLHSTTGRLRDIGAVSHYHLDPNAYEDSTVNSFAALFDAVVQVVPDGAVSVQTRR